MPYEVVRYLAAEEVTEGDTAAALAAANALAKVEHAALPAMRRPGRSFWAPTPWSPLTDGRWASRPRAAEAAEMIAALSGRRTRWSPAWRCGASAALHGAEGAPAGPPASEARRAPRCTSTDVDLPRLDAAQVEAYIASGEWTDKAGAYALQGLAGPFVVGVRGEYSNVVGLPLCLLARLFREAGFDLLYGASGL